MLGAIKEYPMAVPDNKSPGRAGRPVTSGGLSLDDALRKAMRTPPPEHDPKAPKVVKAKRKKASPKAAKKRGA